MALKPRLFFTPEPDLAAALATIATITGKPVSSVIADAMDAVRPYLVQRAKSLEWAADAKSRAKVLGDRAAGHASESFNSHRQVVEQALSYANAAIERDQLRRDNPRPIYLKPGGGTRVGPTAPNKRKSKHR